MLSDLKYKQFFQETSQNYWGSKGAGCIFIAEDTGRILMVLRGDDVDGDPNTWGCIGGKIDGGENPKEAVLREIEEETGYNGKSRLVHLHTYRDGDFTYENYLDMVPFEFTPQLNWEHSNSKWVEFGNWPEPLHFGMVELINRAGKKIKKIIDLLKKKRDNLFEVDTPPEIQLAHHFSPEFINYIKTVENSNNAGYKHGLWFPVDSPEGGNKTVAYGHKIKNGENMDKGIADDIAEKLLKQDLEDARRIVYSDIKSMAGIQIPLDDKQEEMLTDFAYNLGTIKKFPKFTRAVLDKDWKTVAHEYKRTFKDVHGERHELARNKIFFDRYLKEICLESDIQLKPCLNNEENSNQIIVKPQGLVDDGIYGYEIKSNTSFVRYGLDPQRRIFYLYSISTPKIEDRNKGYAKELLEYLFNIIKDINGLLEPGTYTTSGQLHIKHVIERLAKQYRVRLI